MDHETAKLIAAAIAVIPLFGVGIGLGMIFSAQITALGRNPEAKNVIGTPTFLAFALTEAIALFALVVSLYILFGA